MNVSRKGIQAELVFYESPAFCPFHMRRKAGFCILTIDRTKKILVLVTALVSMVSLVSCRQQRTGPSRGDVVERVVEDDLGRAVRLPGKIDSAVSLAPNLTEIVFAVGGGDQLRGVTTFCNYPEAAKAIPSVGDTMNPNMENIAALKPQVVFVSTASQIEAFTSRLEQQGVKTFVTNPSSINDVYRSIFSVGEILGKQENAEKLVEGLKLRADAVETKVKGAAKPKIFVQISKEPLYTVGNNSFLYELIMKAGGDPVTKGINEAYPRYSKESALAANPDVIILSDSNDNREPNDAFNNSPAVKNGKVFRINADILSRPGPRVIDALEQIAKALHPEKFN
jgi:iron complex transport system substrate-binding protein